MTDLPYGRSPETLLTDADPKLDLFERYPAETFDAVTQATQEGREAKIADVLLLVRRRETQESAEAIRRDGILKPEVADAIETLASMGIFPTASAEPLAALHKMGARLIICRRYEEVIGGKTLKDKSPVRGYEGTQGAWKKTPHLPLADILAAAGRDDRLIAIIPGTVGVSAVDLDQGSQTAVVDVLGPPAGRYRHTTAKAGST